MYKTELCERFDTDGKCIYGKRCIFAHSTAELNTRRQFKKP